MDATTPAGSGAGFDDLVPTVARMAELTTVLAARLERANQVEDHVAGVVGHVEAIHGELDGVRADLAALDRRLTAALDAVARTSSRVDLLSEQSLDAAAGIAANVARSVEASTASAAQAGRVAERMWADVTRALAAFSGEATQAVGAVAERAEQAEQAAVAALTNTQRLEAIVRTELVGLRQGLRAASDEIITGLGRSATDLPGEIRAVVAAELDAHGATIASSLASSGRGHEAAEAAEAVAHRLDDLGRALEASDARHEAHLEQADAAVRAASVVASEAALGAAERVADEARSALAAIGDHTADVLAQVRSDARTAVDDLNASSSRAVGEVSTMASAAAAEAVAALQLRADLLLTDAASVLTEAASAVGGDTPEEISRLVRAELIGVRQALRAAVAGMEDTALASSARLADRIAGLEASTSTVPTAVSTAIERAMLQGWPESVETAMTQTSRELQNVIAQLLSEQLAAIDQRQGVIEDGLRAMWHRLDELDTALAGVTAASAEGGATSALTAAVNGAVARWEGAEAALVKVAAAIPPDIGALPERVRTEVEAASGQTEARIAGLTASLPDLVAEVVGGQLSAALAPLAERLSDVAAGRVAAAAGTLVERISEVVTSLADRVSDAAVAQVATSMGPVGDLPALVEGFSGALVEFRGVFDTAVGGLPERTAEAVRRAGEELTEALTLELAGMPGRVAVAVTGATADLTAVLAGVDQRVVDAVSTGLVSLPATVAGEVASRLPTDVGPTLAADVAAAVVAAVGGQVGAQLAEEASARLVAEVTTRLAAEVGIRLADEIGTRLAAEIGAHVAAEVGTRLADDIGARLVGGIGAGLATDVAARATDAIANDATARIAEDVRRLLAEGGETIGAEVARALRDASAETMRLARAAGDDAVRALEHATETAVTDAASRAAAEATAAILTAVHDVYATISAELVRDAVAAIEAHLPAGSLLSVTERIDSGIRDAARQAAELASAHVVSVQAALAAARAAAEDAQATGALAAEAAETAGREAAGAAAAVRSLVEVERAVVLDEAVLAQIVAAATAALAERIGAPGGPMVSNLRPAVQVAVDAALSTRLQDAVDGALASRLKGAIDEVMGPRVQATVEAAWLATADAARAAGAEAASEAATAMLSRGGHVPLDVSEIASGVTQAVAATLDEFGARVDRDIDGLELRIQSLATILEDVVAAVQDTLSRRRGASTEALELLRQVAAEQAQPRRRGSPGE